MAAQVTVDPNHVDFDTYTYPQFIISETTGQIEVNFIDKNSGRVVRHIPSTELNEIVRAFYFQRDTKLHDKQQ